MTDVTVIVDGVPRRVPANITVAVALLRLGITAFRRDGSGASRAPLCAMGSCFECRITIDGRPMTRSCLETVRDGMLVETVS